jgi:valyl-tRNA synthetase
MSKSKGNGVDPVDIIDGYGADALRFTLTTMATETQDARMPVKKDAAGRNTSDKFDLGRNFCNKLWNAARFALGNLGETPAKKSPAAEPLGSPLAQERAHPAGSLADRWIVSRFNRAVRELNEALAVYRFDVYAKICYDFFWRDLCDWYVEAIKPAMKDPARSAQTADVLAAILDGILRLMHPMIPFITERLWWQLNEVRPQRGLPGRIDCPASKRLILAPWPNASELDESAETAFPQVQEIIVAIRNVRNQYKVDVKKPVTVSIAAPAESKRLIEDSREIIELLGTCTLAQVEPKLSAPANAARALAAGCEIFIEGIVDPQAEKQRLGKRRDELVKLISSMRGRLANEAYISKAPAHLVKQTQDQLAEAEAELARLG